MVSVGVGSVEWQELDSPCEWDEPNLVILLKALDIFRPAPFMLATRMNKNEQEQLDSGYVSEMKVKLLPECCSSKCVDNLTAKKWEREFSCNQTWAKIQRKPEQRMWEGVWVSVWAWESSTPLSRPLFKGEWACAPEERQATTVMEPLEKVGPRSHWPWVGQPVGSAGPRVGPLVPPFGQILPQRS